MTKKFSDPVAQSVEQHPFKGMVAGSLPARVTLYLMNNHLYIIIFYLLFCSCSIMNDNIPTLEKNESEVKKLIFIYNASDDALSVSFDFIHKIVSPDTYQCSLCKVTYGNVSMHNEWKEYIEILPYEIDFLYKNNYNQFHPNLFVDEFPIAYKYDGKSYQEFISKKEFDLCENLDDLIKIMNQKIY